MTDTNNDDILDNGVVADSEPETVTSDEDIRLDGDDVVEEINEQSLPMSVDKLMEFIRGDCKCIRRRIMDTDFEEMKEYTSVFGIGAISVFILMYIRYIIMFIAMIGSAIGINFIIVSYMMRQSGFDDEVIDFTFEHDPEIRRLKFQNANYEELYDAYMKVDEVNQPFDDLVKLKDFKEHMVIDADALPCKKIIMYYDSEEEVFKYYTQVGDMTQPMLNAACRQYCIEKNVVQLYNDESDWAFMVETYGSEEDQKKLEKYLPAIEEEPETDELEKRKGSFIDVTEKNSNDDNESNENDEKPASLFVSKSDGAQKKEEKTVKRNTIVEKKTNRFLKMGSIDDYDTDKNAKERSEKTKDVDYKTFMQSLFSKPKQE